MSDTISCPQCSAPLPAGAVFCTGCGHRLEADSAPAPAAPPAPTAEPAAPPAQSAPPEDATRVDTPGLHDATQTFAAQPPVTPQTSGGQGAAPGAPWQPADAGAPGPAAWTPPPQAPQAPQGQPAPQAWQQPQPGAAPEGWVPPNQDVPSTWDTTGTAPTSTPTKTSSPLGGLVALVGGLLTLAGLFTAWFQTSIGGVNDTIIGWELTSGDTALESKDPYILLALGIVAVVIGVLFFMGQKRLLVRIAAVLVGIAIVGVTANDWMTTADVVKKQFAESDELTQAFGFYLTIAGGIVTAVAAILPAKK